MTETAAVILSHSRTAPVVLSLDAYREWRSANPTVGHSLIPLSAVEAPERPKERA